MTGINTSVSSSLDCRFVKYGDEDDVDAELRQRFDDIDARYHIDWDELTARPLTALGSGQFGCVYRAEWRATDVAEYEKSGSQNIKLEESALTSVKLIRPLARLLRRLKSAQSCHRDA